MAAGLTTGTALNAFFHLCVPAVSDGAMQQTFPADKVVALTAEEKSTYTDTSRKTGEYWRIASSDGFILLDVAPPYCRIVTQDDDPPAIKADFLSELEKAGGKFDGMLKSTPDAETVSAMIPLTHRRSIAISFTVSLEKNAKGFFASAFLVEKTR